METTLWELFCETGDPMGYLLYREELRSDTAVPGTSPDRGGRSASDPPGDRPRPADHTVSV